MTMLITFDSISHIHLSVKFPHAKETLSPVWLKARKFQYI